MSIPNFSQIDSPWIIQRDANWCSLTKGQPVRTYKKGHIFYEQHEYSKVFVVREGRVAMCLCTVGGDIRVTTILDKGCIFGHQYIFDNGPNSCRAMALSDSVSVYEIPRDEAKRLIESDQGLLHSIIEQGTRLNRMLLTQVYMMNFQRSEERVCFLLLHMADQYSDMSGDDDPNRQKISIRLTHQDIAELAGLSRVSVSNVFSQLTKEGILSKHNGRYCIENVAMLEKKIGSL